MKRRLILLIILVIALALFGNTLNSPPSFLDGVSGATPRAKRAAQAAAILEGEYEFGINPDADGLTDEEIRTEIKDFVSGQSDDLPDAEKINLHISVLKTDYALVRSVEKLCEKFEAAGAKAGMTEYSSTMMFSKIVSGRYEAFFLADGEISQEDIEKTDSVTIDSSEME